MRITKLIYALPLIGFIVAQSNVALAACPPEGCPRGYACAGNPIFSSCVPVEIKKKEKKKGASSSSMKKKSSSSKSQR